MREFEGHVALVSGGGSGIGRGIVLALAGEGMRVVVADVESDAAEAVAAEITAAGGEAFAETVDVSDVAAVEALADRCDEHLVPRRRPACRRWLGDHRLPREVRDRGDERYGGIGVSVLCPGGVDVLCNNAGVVGHTPIGPESLDSWRWILDVNLFGVVHAINTFVPRMRARVAESGGEAHVVNTSSLGGGLLAGGGWEITAYRASKFAIVAMSRDLRAELAGSGIGVSVLCPGGVETRIWQAGRNRPAEHGGPQTWERPGRLKGERVIGPLEVGRRVLHAIRENELYAITHPERKHQVEAGARELLDAFDLATNTPV